MAKQSNVTELKSGSDEQAVAWRAIQATVHELTLLLDDLAHEGKDLGEVGLGGNKERVAFGQLVNSLAKLRPMLQGYAAGRYAGKAVA